MKVGDKVISGRNVWDVTGIYLAGLGGQDLIGLAPNGDASAHGKDVEEMIVPRELIAGIVFTQAQ